MRWTFDTVSRIDDLKARCLAQQTYLRRAQCDAPPAAKALYNGRVAVLARRFGVLSKHARQLRRMALATGR